MRGIIVRTVALLLCTAVVAYAAARAGARHGATVPHVLQAQRFELVDAQGRVVARLSTSTKGEAQLEMLDRKGRLQVGLGSKEGKGGVLALCDAAGKARLTGAVTGSSGPALVLFDAREEARLLLGARPPDYTGLSVFDETGRERAALALMRPAREPRIPGAMLRLASPDRRAEVVGFATEDGQSSLLTRRGGTEVWRVPQGKG